MRDLEQALFWSWLLLSLVGACVVLAALVLPEHWVLFAGRTLQAPHEHGACPLCGMTRALVAIGDGNFSRALGLNRWSLVFVGIVLVSGLAAAAALIRRVRSVATRASVS
jgi:hypothetical protein